MNLMQKYIKDTPAQLKIIIEDSKELFAKVSQLDIERIMITGSGTSYHSGLQMQQLMRIKSGLEVNSYYPFQVTNELFNGNVKKTLFIGISQGGSSFSTFEAMKVAKENGCIIATMAGEGNAYIDQLADEILTVNIGEEDVGAKTKGYYATKLNLLLLAEYIGLANENLSKQDFDHDINHIFAMLDQYSVAYDRVVNWLEVNKEQIAKASNIRIVGPASFYGDTLEGALKILENCRIPVSGYEFNEFIHGIYNAIDEQSTLIFIDDGSEPRMAKMLEVLGEWTEELYVIDFSRVVNSHKLGYGIDGGTDIDEMRTFIFPLACQMMAAILPEVKHINPNIPKDMNFHMKLESKKYNR